MIAILVLAVSEYPMSAKAYLDLIKAYKFPELLLLLLLNFVRAVIANN